MPEPANGASTSAPSSHSTSEAKKAEKKPADTAFKQQRLPACKPVLKRWAVITVFMAIAVIFIPIGVVTLYFGLLAEEVSIRYDDQCLQQFPRLEEKLDHLYKNAGNNAALTCPVTLTIEKDMDAPVYIYYEIRGMFQNHRRYVRSHVDQQLAQSGSYSTYLTEETQSQNCLPLVFYPLDAEPKLENQTVNPCGLVAWSYFNDSYVLQVDKSNGSQFPLNVSAKGIAFQADVTHRFANYTPQYFNPKLDENRGGNNITTTLKEDERFIVWMRLAHMSRFRKLWGIIDTDLKAGDTVNVEVVNQYNTYSFAGEKHLVLSTTTWLGGRSVFLGVAYVSAGGLSMLFALVYWVVSLIKPRELGDTRLLARKATTNL